MVEQISLVPIDRIEQLTSMSIKNPSRPLLHREDLVLVDIRERKRPCVHEDRPEPDRESVATATEMMPDET